jgi:hypothetical protein
VRRLRRQETGGLQARQLAEVGAAEDWMAEPAKGTVGVDQTPEAEEQRNSEPDCGKHRNRGVDMIKGTGICWASEI